MPTPALDDLAAVARRMPGVGPAATTAGLFASFDALVGAWIDHFGAHASDRQAISSALFELDPEARAAARAVIDAVAREALGVLVAQGAERGELRPDVEADSLVALLVLLLPHLALAPFIADLDPVLGTHGLDREALSVPVRGLLGALERAFSTEHAAMTP